MFKKRIPILVILILIFIIIVSFYAMRKHNVDYQMEKLANGTPDQKVIAADFMIERNILTSIPIMIENLNDDRVADPYGKAPDDVYCFMGVNLEIITGKKLGYICASSSGNYTEEEYERKKQEIISAWKNWYTNEYQIWLESKNITQ